MVAVVLIAFVVSAVAVFMMATAVVVALAALADGGVSGGSGVGGRR